MWFSFFRISDMLKKKLVKGRQTLRILEVRDLWKRYQEDWVLKGINMEIEPGEILGLIGENGAGKSTLIQCIMGLVQPTKGTILIRNIPFREDEMGAKRSLAYIPEFPLLYSDLTVWEHLKFVAMAFDMDREVFEERAGELLREFQLYDRRNSIPTNFSKGMKQKVAISCALLHDAQILLVDEPFTGLDVSSVRDLKARLMDLNEQGKTLIIASHMLESAERMCRRFLVLKKGQCMTQGSLAQLRELAGLSKDSSLEEVYLSLVEGRENDE